MSGRATRSFASPESGPASGRPAVIPGLENAPGRGGGPGRRREIALAEPRFALVDAEQEDIGSLLNWR